MDQYRSIGIAAALGGGTGTMLAMTLGQRWFPGAVIGIVLGALIGGLSFRPLEVATTLCSVVRTRWRVLTWSVGALAILAGYVALCVRWPSYAAVLAIAAAAACVMVLGWPYRTALTRAVLWFTVNALTAMWVVGTIVVGSTALPLVAVWSIGGPDSWLFILLLGALLSLVSLALTSTVWGTGCLWSIAKSDTRPRWQWAFTRWFLPLINLYDEPPPYSPDPITIPPDWGNLQINERYIRWPEFIRLSRMTGEIVFLVAISPLIMVGILITSMSDVVVIIALALASTGRLAAMEGALIGSATGFAASRAGATPLVAVALGAAVAVASGIGLYRLRRSLDTRTEVVPA